MIESICDPKRGDKAAVSRNAFTGGNLAQLHKVFQNLSQDMSEQVDRPGLWIDLNPTPA